MKDDSSGLCRKRVTLEDHIQGLLRDGKRSQHEDFKLLFRVYGRDKIVEIAKRFLEQEKAAQEEARPDESQNDQSLGDENFRPNAKMDKLL